MRVVPASLIFLPFRCCFSICFVIVFLTSVHFIHMSHNLLLPNLYAAKKMPCDNFLPQMSDQELFELVSLRYKANEYPSSRNIKIAFMFLTMGPIPLAPLWEKFFRGQKERFSIYIHSPPSYIPAFPRFSVFYGRNISSQITRWGEMSIVEAEKRLLANALLDESNERFVLLSESCIPLYNFTFIYNYIINSKTSFVNAYDDPGPHARGRYNQAMAPEVNITEWRKGHQWFEVEKHLAVSLVLDTKYHLVFKNFCQTNCYPDEHYFPTFLTIKAPKLIANRSLTWVDWSRGGWHPATFGRDDVSPEFFHRITHSDWPCNYNNMSITNCVLFARKFAPNALWHLLHISSSVFGF